MRRADRAAEESQPRATDAKPKRAREPLTRKQRQARTRSSLMRSAAQVFARRGMHGASVEEVALGAGFTKGAFYANFASKEELFLAMLDERFAERLRQIELLSSADSEIEERARAAGEEFASYLAADPDWQLLFFEFAAHAGREERFRSELVGRYRALREGIAAILRRRGEELGLALPVEPERLAMMTFAMANGFALERVLEPEAASEELYGAMLAIFFAGLRALAQEATEHSGPSGTERPAGA